MTSLNNYLWAFGIGSTLGILGFNYRSILGTILVEKFVFHEPGLFVLLYIYSNVGT